MRPPSPLGPFAINSKDKRGHVVGALNPVFTGDVAGHGSREILDVDEEIGEMTGSRRHLLLDIDSSPFGICFKRGSFNVWKCFFSVDLALLLVEVCEGHIG